MNDGFSSGPKWASTDLRWRGSTGNVSTPISSRGFVEDYGEDIRSTRKGCMAWFWQCLWRWRKTSVSVPMISTIAITVSILTIEMTEENWLVRFSSFCTIGISFLLLLQRRKIKKMGSVRHQNNELRRKAHYFHQERERLHRTMDRLDEKAADLHSVPHELHKLTKSKDIERLMKVVDEQKAIQEKMRRVISQQVMQQIMSLVVRVDRDSNWTLRPTEIEALIVRLGLIESIEFDEQKLRLMLEYDPTVTTIMRIIRSLLERDDEYELGNPIFRIKT